MLPPRISSCWFPFWAAFCAVIVGGCADHSKISRPTVSQLYNEALSAATVGDSFAPSNSNNVENDSLTPVVLRDNYEPIFEPQSSGLRQAAFSGVHVAEPFLEDPGEESKLITEFFSQTDLREAIEIIAEQTGDTVIIDDTVGGVVTLQITDANFEDALKTLLLPLGLVYAVHDGSYIVAPPDPDSPLFVYVADRFRYEPKYHLASKLVELLPLRFREFYQLSDDRNLIVIDAPTTLGEEMLTRLSELDQPVQQVVLEAIVCVTAPDCEFRFGMDWNHVMALESADQLNVGLNGLAFGGATSAYGMRNAFDDFAVTSAFVQLLSKEGYVTIRAAPRVTAKDGEKASISIARETFFSLQPSASNVLFRQDVQKVDAGINLMITPKIRGDMVTVEIEKAEVSEDIRTSDPRPELSANPYPIINRRQVSTKVDVRDGHTIVIGGLVQRQTVDRVNRIPGLSAIPGVGRLFRTIEKQEQDAEVAIFISPRIVPISQSH